MASFYNSVITNLTSSVFVVDKTRLRQTHIEDLLYSTLADALLRLLQRRGQARRPSNTIRLTFPGTIHEVLALFQLDDQLTTRRDSP
jgi:hypothetical protein